MCDRLFQNQQNTLVRAMAPAHGQAAGGGYQCPNIEESSTPWMYVPGAAILHELIHWQQSELDFGPPGGGIVLDWNHLKAPNVDPPRGYVGLPQSIVPDHS